jgi:hypothetical protein
MKPLPRSAKELSDALVGIFPAFSGNFEELASSSGSEGEVNFHALMLEFTFYFGKETAAFSERQLAQLAELLVLGTQGTGPLENAIDTCFLEHTRQIKVSRQLAPWLAKARAKHGA